MLGGCQIDLCQPFMYVNGAGKAAGAMDANLRGMAAFIRD
jgi:hypothetical protein